MHLYPPAMFTTAMALGLATIAAADPVTFDRDTYPSAARPRTIAVADFNRDGRLDLAVGGTGRASIGILLAETGEDAGFHLAHDIVVGGGPFDLAVGDLNRDGIPDLVVANADSNAVTILTGRGDGSFNPKRDVAIGGNPRGIAVADLTGDGRLDVLVTRYASNDWLLLPGDGAGNLGTATTYAAGTSPQGITAADLDHDGALDVIVANTGTAALSVFYRPGRSGSTRRDVAISTPINVVTTGDFNRDGWIDVAAASSDQSAGVTLRGSATGLVTPTPFATGGSPRGITAIDLNQDGRLDLVVGNRASSTVTVNLGLASGGFGSPTTLPAGGGSRVVAAADFDHDGRVDIASANETDSTVSLFVNTTAFVRSGQDFSPLMLGEETGYGGPTALRPADFDHDGKLDLATIDAQDALIFMGNGTTVDVPGNFPSGLAVADVNEDGNADVLLSMYWDDTIETFLGDGHGGFTRLSTVVAAATSSEMEVGDLDRDGHLDVVIETYDDARDASALRVLRGRGNGTFVLGAPISEPTHANGLALVDLDRDGVLDLASNEFDPPGVRIRYGDGKGGWRSSTFVPLPEDAADVTGADVNADGRPDLVLAMWDAVGVLLASGSGFAPLEQYRLPEPYIGYGYAYRLGVGDLDLDGDLDIADNSADVKRNRGDGTFEPIQFAGWGSETAILDYNRDGLPDILMVGNGWTRILIAKRSEANHAPTVDAGPDATIEYAYTGDSQFGFEAAALDPDQHDLRYEWRNQDGELFGTGPGFEPPTLPPGEYAFIVTAFDDRGGSASDTVHLTVTPTTEIYVHPGATAWPLNGGWEAVEDATAAEGWRVSLPDAGLAKVTTPAASPAQYFEVSFKADPSQSYKLWIRGKAQGNSPYNDSVFLQFSGSTDAAGNPRWRIDTTDALTFNLEECASCGVSGWGWEDDAWGAVNQNGGLLRFPEGGWQRVRIQVREDGLSIDQIVLSSERYVSTRPGTAKNDTTLLPSTVPE